MTRTATYPTIACDGCKRHTFVLRAVDGAHLCETCIQKSAEIDRRLENVDSRDPVDCDGCGDSVAFDARVAVVVRACGGAVHCDFCQPASMAAREAS